ncbi:MAG: hypothetical protein HY775_00145 [Acidobacteria bacterium]|nr:hypothetical protein [Acidobacteriota bacterium]
MARAGGLLAAVARWLRGLRGWRTTERGDPRAKFGEFFGGRAERAGPGEEGGT